MKQSKILIEFLRREYKITGIRVEHKSKHDKLLWTHAGQEHSYFVSRGTFNNSKRSLDNAKARIRRMLNKEEEQ